MILFLVEEFQRETFSTCEEMKCYVTSEFSGPKRTVVCLL
jgi:hypothetical protein